MERSSSDHVNDKLVVCGEGTSCTLEKISYEDPPTHIRDLMNGVDDLTQEENRILQRRAARLEMENASLRGRNRELEATLALARSEPRFNVQERRVVQHRYTIPRSSHEWADQFSSMDFFDDYFPQDLRPLPLSADLDRNISMLLIRIDHVNMLKRSNQRRLLAYETCIGSHLAGLSLRLCRRCMGHVENLTRNLHLPRDPA